MRTIAWLVVLGACATPPDAPPACDAPEVLKEVRSLVTLSAWTAALAAGRTELLSDDAELDGGSVTGARELALDVVEGSAVRELFARDASEAKTRSCSGRAAPRGGTPRDVVWTVTTLAAPGRAPWEPPRDPLRPYVHVCDAHDAGEVLSCPEIFVSDEVWRAVWPEVARPRAAGGGG